jgi:hypothetical protein
VLLIVDGLVAFKGSANLTNTGRRKADRGLNIHETITKYAKVTNLNNIYFAPVWRRFTAPEDVFCPGVAMISPPHHRATGWSRSALRPLRSMPDLRRDQDGDTAAAPSA